MIEPQDYKYRKYQKWVDDILLEMNQPDTQGWNKRMYKDLIEDICKICKHETGKYPQVD